MAHYLLDTNHVSAVFKQHAGIVNRIRSVADSEFGIALPVIGELWFMVYNSARIAQNTKNLEMVLADFTTWDFDHASAREFGRIKAELRRSGRTIPDVDVQIAAIARHHALTLLTADAHFSAVTGLVAENWLAQP